MGTVTRYGSQVCIGGVSGEEKWEVLDD